jgi:hypothetical protein
MSGPRDLPTHSSFWIVRGNAADSGIFAPPLSGDRKPVAIAPAAVAPNSPRFSPDGRWIAYGSIESQRAEIYVVPYSGLGGRLPQRHQSTQSALAIGRSGVMRSACGNLSSI